MVCTKLNLSVEMCTNESERAHNFGPAEIKEFQRQLDVEWVNPSLYCFERLYQDDERKSTRATNVQKVRLWNPTQFWYEDIYIILRCHGTAIRDVDTPLTKRSAFNGYPYTTVGELTPNKFVVDLDTNGLQLGLGYTNKEGVIHIYKSRGSLFFEDDCLWYGIFDLDRQYASMNIASEGWTEIEGVPFIKDPVKNMK